jgi:hypothetical protein
MKNDKLVNIRKYGPACHFSSARAFTFAQRVKQLNIVGLNPQIRAIAKIGILLAFGL